MKFNENRSSSGWVALTEATFSNHGVAGRTTTTTTILRYWFKTVRLRFALWFRSIIRYVHNLICILCTLYTYATRLALRRTHFDDSSPYKILCLRILSTSLFLFQSVRIPVNFFKDARFLFFSFFFANLIQVMFVVLDKYFRRL